MKAILDHVGIAVRDIDAALAFYRDALGLEIEAPEEVLSQHVRAHFVPVGQSALELLEATTPNSAIAKYLEKRGPGIHHITLRVDDIRAALATLTLTPPANSDADIRLQVTASTHDSVEGVDHTFTSPLVVAVHAVADLPTGHGSGSGREDTFIAVPVVVALSDTDGSECLQSVVVQGIPQGSGGQIQLVDGAGTRTLPTDFSGVLTGADAVGDSYTVTGDGRGGFTFTGSTAGIQAALDSLDSVLPSIAM